MVAVTDSPEAAAPEDALKTMLARHGVRARLGIAERRGREIHELLLAQAAAERADLLVMGAYGRNRITDYFLGSNAAAVARTSPVSVLLAR